MYNWQYILTFASADREGGGLEKNPVQITGTRLSGKGFVYFAQVSIFPGTV